MLTIRQPAIATHFARTLKALGGKVLLGLTIEQLMMLAGVAVALVVLLVVLRTIFRLTRILFRVGCLGVIVVLVVAFALMRGFGG